MLKMFTHFVALAFVFLFTTASATSNDVALVGTPIAIEIPGYDRMEGPLTPVSMTQLGDGTLLIANYRNIYSLDLNTRKARPVFLDTQLPMWAPTGLHYSSNLGLLFIANYVGNDVLIASVTRDSEKISLKLIDRLTEGTAIDGPEGVSTSPDGRYLAIANYDGASISLFEQVDGAWTYRWTTPLVVAHGVTILGEYVYGSGNSIAKIDIKTGVVIATTKITGVSPLSFVTCLNPDERSGGLIGADAIGGFVFTIDENLEKTSQFGANGPTNINFSMPYCAYQIAGTTYILSTYQDRIIVLDPSGTRSIEFYADERWNYTKPVTDYRMQSDDWKKTTVEAMLFGKRISPGYASIATDEGVTFLMPASNHAFSANWPFYATTIARDGD